MLRTVQNTKGEEKILLKHTSPARFNSREHSSARTSPEQFQLKTALAHLNAYRKCFVVLKEFYAYAPVEHRPLFHIPTQLSTRYSQLLVERF